MAITIASNTQSEAEIQEAMKVNGLAPNAPEPKPDAKVAVEGEKTEGEPGDKVPAEPKDKEPVEAAGDKSQETTQEPEEKTEKPKSKGGFQYKLEKKTRELSEARELLEEERGDKTRLRQKVEELEAQLTALKPAEPAKAQEPTKPTRPKLKDFEYDQDKFDTAMSEFDEKLDKYYADLSESKAQAAMAKKEEEWQEGERRREAEKLDQEYRKRLRKNAELYDDYDDLMERMPVKARTVLDDCPGIANYITDESEQPAHLIHFFMHDYLENGGEEGERIASLKPAKQLLEIAAIEQRLIREAAGEPEAEDKPKPKVAAEPEKKTPAKEQPKRAEALEEPITPVGSRAGSKGKSLHEQMREASEQGNAKEFNRLFALQQKEARAAQV